MNLTSQKLNFKKDSGFLELDGQEFTLNDIVQRVIGYKSQNNQNLFETINQDYVFSLFEREKLQEIEKGLLDAGKKHLNIVQYVKIFLSHIDHTEEETLYLTISLIDFFKSISESLNLAQVIKFSDITTAICKKIEHSYVDEYSILTRSQLPHRRFTESLEDHKKQPLNFKSPIVYDKDQHVCLKRIHKGKFKTDSTSHHGRKIKNAVFAKEIKRVITLDSLDTKIQIYDLNCELKSSIDVKCKDDDEILEVIIFGMAWSERQQRIGAVLKNYSMSFWDGVNDFKFEKNFSVHGCAQDYQSSIWYLEKHNMWLTTDSTNIINCWDLSNEVTLFSLASHLINAAIFDIIELPDLELVAVGAQDKKVTFWNFTTQTFLFQIESEKVGVHSIAYSNAFQIFITAGYENNIQLYIIDKAELDYTLVGSLRGHISMISCISVIEGTPMVVSSDDQGKIRLWDIRNQSCIQTYECSSSQTEGNSFAKKIHIHLILDLFSEGMIALLGSRLNLIHFDEREEIIKNKSTSPLQFPLSVEINQQRDELVVCTNKQLKFYDLQTGRCNFSINGMMENEQDEITSFKQVTQGQGFLLGNSRGQISLHSYSQKGETLKYLNGHADEVTQLKIDYNNKLLISGGCDSSIIIQKLSDEQTELKRTINHAHFDKGISMLEVSVYHNVIFSAAVDSKKLLVFDYEYGKLLNFIEFKQRIEPTAMSVTQGFPILVVATNDNIVYIICFTKKEYQITFDLLATIRLDNKGAQIPICQIPNSFFITKQFDETTKNPNKKNGQTDFQITLPKVKGKRSLNSSLSTILTAKKTKVEENVFKFDLSREEMMEEQFEEKEVTNLITKILPDFQYNSSNKLERSLLFCTTNQGFLLQFDLFQLFNYHSKIPFIQHACTRLNYNAQRNSTENFNLAISKFSGVSVRYSEVSQPTNKFLESGIQLDVNSSINEVVSHNIRAHKDQITSLLFLNYQNLQIVTSSLDQYVRIWNKSNLQQICSLNINHPLPIQWKYVNSQSDQQQTKIIYALRLLDIIDRTYSQQMTKQEENQFKIIHFLKNLMSKSNQIEELHLNDVSVIKRNSDLKSTQRFLQEILQEDSNDQQKESLIEEMSIEKAYDNDANNKINQILLMNEHYNPQDIKFEKIKHFYKNELLGPSLKRMEVNKRVAIAQKIWKNPPLTKEELEREKAKKMLEFSGKGEERETIINFFDPNYRNYIIKKGFLFEDEYTKPTQNLQKKLEFLEINGQRKSMLTSGSNISFHTNKNVILPEKRLATMNSTVGMSQQGPQRLSFKLDTLSSEHGINRPSSKRMEVSQKKPIDNQLQKNQVSQIGNVQNPSKHKSFQIAITQSEKNEYTTSYNQNIMNSNNVTINNLSLHSNQIQQNSTCHTPKNKNHLQQQIPQSKQINSNSTFAIRSTNPPPSKHEVVMTNSVSYVKDAKNTIQAQPCSSTYIIIKEPNNSDHLLEKNTFLQKQLKSVFSFPELKEVKISCEAFPQTAAKWNQIYNEKDTGTFTNTSVISGYGAKENKTKDIYKYAQDKQILSNRQSAEDSQATSSSPIPPSTFSKLHLVLNGLNSKLKKFKRHNGTNSTYHNADTNQSTSVYDEYKKTGCSMQSSSTSLRNTFHDMNESRQSSQKNKSPKSGINEAKSIYGFFQDPHKRKKGSMNELMTSNNFYPVSSHQSKKNLFSERMAQNRQSLPFLTQNQKNI